MKVWTTFHRALKLIQRNVSFWLFRKCIAWIIELFGSDQESTHLYPLLADLFDELFGNEMTRLWRLSIMFENSSNFCLVNSRPANCDSLMELGQSSTSANYSRSPEACLQRRSSVSQCISECYFRSFQGLSCLCEQCSSFFDNFTTHSSGRDWYVMMV